MRLSRGSIATAKNRLASDEMLSQQILLQSGQVKRYAAGIYAKNTFLVKAQANIEKVIRTTLERYDCVEVVMPLLQPKALWESSGRWDKYNQSGQMFYCDMPNGTYCMAPTAEEAMLDFVQSMVRSYKDLPINVYQIGAKFRNELRSRGGLLRSKEFTMMDAYSFHASQEDLAREYEHMRNAYLDIFQQLGLNVIPVKALNGDMGGNYSEEFMCLSESGEDTILVNSDHTLAFNTELLELENASEYLEKNYGIKADLSTFHEEHCIELGHIFQLGQKYSESMGATFANAENKNVPFYMGCYGIGVSRTLAAICENFCDNDGLCWPVNIAPYKVHIVCADKDKESDANDLYNYFMWNGVEAVLDDRNMTFGSKIKDWKLFGIPYVVIVGKSYTGDGYFEVEERATGEKHHLHHTNILKIIQM